MVANTNRKPDELKQITPKHCYGIIDVKINESETEDLIIVLAK